MDTLSSLADLEKYVAEEPTIDPHHRTVICSKLLHLRMRIEAMIEDASNAQAALLSKLEKKCREHKVSHQLLALSK